MSEKQLIGTLSYDPDEEIIHRDKKTGQIIKISRLPRSHPKIEAKYGPKVYKEKPVESDLGQMRDKYDSMFETVAELKAQLAAKNAEPVEVASTGIGYNQLLNIAKKIDPTIKGRPKTETLEAIVYGDSEA